MPRNSTPQEPTTELRAAVDALDDLVAPPGSAHSDDDDVAVVRGSHGAYFAPRSLRNLDEDQADAAAALQRVALALQQMQGLLVEHVDAARAVGLSWHGIGWSLGTTGEAVRKRFGATSD